MGIISTAGMGSTGPSDDLYLCSLPAHNDADHGAGNDFPAANDCHPGGYSNTQAEPPPDT